MTLSTPKLAPILLSLLAGSVILAAGSDASAQSVTRAHIDPKLGVEWAWSGLLSPPSSATPEAIARTYAGGLPAVRSTDLALLRSARLPGGGSLVVLEQRAGTLRVIGGQLAVRIDAQGRVRWAASRIRPLPSLLGRTPSLSANQAAARAGWTAGRGTPRTELVVYAPAGRAPRLAYRVTLPFDPLRREVVRAFIDASTGQLLARDNLVRQVGQARVFAVNPVETPGTETVQLTGLNPGANRLVGPEQFATTCLDNDSCTDFGGGFFFHFCEFAPRATADANDDFLAYDFVSDLEEEDPFAEVQVFHHTQVVLARARELGGFDGLDQQIQIVANYREDAGDDGTNCEGTTYLGDQPLAPLDNAFFSSFRFDGTEGPMITFGQGSASDFGYDGDVVYHEFGHGVMAQVAPDLGFGGPDQYGLDSTPGGLHEGYADLMTMFVTGDPEIGEYASTAFGVPAIRNLDNDYRCPGGLTGEGHYDSEVMTGAIWAAREALPERDRIAFDQAVFAAQRAFGPDTNFITAAQLTSMEVEASLGPDAAAAVDTVLTARGFDDCATRVASAADVHRQLYMLDFFGLGGTVPSVVQWRLEFAGTADAIAVDIASVFDLGAGSGEPIDLELGVKPGDAPILWSDGPGGRTPDYTLSAPFEFTASGPALSGRAVLQGPFEAGVYHLQLVVRSAGIFAENITITAEGADEEPDAGPVEPDAGPADVDAGGDNPGDGGDGDGDDGGCGCRAAQADRTLGGTGLLVVALWLAWRRRRAA